MGMGGLDHEDVNLAEIVGMLTYGESVAPLAFALQDIWHTEGSLCGWSSVTRGGCMILQPDLDFDFRSCGNHVGTVIIRASATTASPRTPCSTGTSVTAWISCTTVASFDFDF